MFGGAFDPPHLGHKELARTALEQLQLDVLHVIPTGLAGHKERPLTPAAHRLEMARLTFADMGGVIVDPRETLRTGVSYTMDTLEELRGEYPGSPLYLVVGQDQAQALSTWHRWPDILKIAIICVAARAVSAGSSTVFDAKSLPLTDFQRLEMPPMDISATELRRRLAQRQSVAPLVFEPVARYIALHHLYQST